MKLRQNKTRTSSDCRNIRAMPRKMFATDGSEKDPIVVYKLYAQKKNEKMLEDDFPFYLAVNNNLKVELLQTKEWFKVGPVGMKTMAQKAEINNERLRNHSGRKTMTQTLSENDIAPTHIAQLSGHKNLKGMESYSKVSTKQQMKMSQVLSSVVAGTATKTSSFETANPVISPSTSKSQLSMALFSGAVSQGGNFSININTVNQSLKLSLKESSPPEELLGWKRMRPLEDSDDE